MESGEGSTMRNFIVCTVHLMWLNPEDYDGLFIHFCVGNINPLACAYMMVTPDRQTI